MQSKIDLLNTEISGWQIVAHLFEHDENQHWALLKRDRVSDGWENYRLCACGGKMKKKSYWLAYSPTRQRMAASKDGHHLAWGKPELMRKLMRYLGKPRTPSKEGRVSTTKRALERLRRSNPFDRAN
jgi:hypothetical protein